MEAYKKANTVVAIFLILFCRQKYIDAAISHSIAISIQDKDLGKLYEAGKHPTPESLVETRKNIVKFSELLQKKIIKSFLWASGIAIIIVLVGYYTGKIHYSFSFDIEHILSIIGTLLLLWGSLISLGPELETYKGKALHENIFSAFRGFLLLIGTLLLIIVYAI